MRRGESGTLSSTLSTRTAELALICIQTPPFWGSVDTSLTRAEMADASIEVTHVSPQATWHASVYFCRYLLHRQNEYPASLPARRRLAGGCGDWAPEMVQCYNMGQDGFDAAWKCEANMPDGYSFSSVEVCPILRSSMQITREEAAHCWALGLADFASDWS